MRIIYGFRYRRDHDSDYRRPVYLEGPWWRVTAYRVARWLFYRAMAADEAAAAMGVSRRTVFRLRQGLRRRGEVLPGDALTPQRAPGCSASGGHRGG